MTKLRDLEWAGQTVGECLALPYEASAPDDWLDASGAIVVALEDDGETVHPSVAWLYSTDEDTVVGAVFLPSLWVEPTARAWITEHGETKETVQQTIQMMSAMQDGEEQPKEATFWYFRKLIELLRSNISDELFEKMRAIARGHAGGKLKGDKQEEPEEQPVVEVIPVAARVRPASFAVSNIGGGDHPYVAYMRPDPTSAYGAWSGAEEKEEGAIQVVWKLVSRVGTVFQPFTGEPARITREILEGCYESFGQAYQYVDIPLGHEWDSPDRNTGFIRALRLEEHPKGLRLWAAMHFTEPNIAEMVLRGTVADVSVWIDYDILDQRTGSRRWVWALAHVCLTNKPLMTDLVPFTVRDIKVGSRTAVLYTSAPPKTGEARIMAPKFKEATPVSVTQPHDMAVTGEVYLVAAAQDGVFYQLRTTQGDLLAWFSEEELEEADLAAAAAGEGAAPAPEFNLDDPRIQQAIEKKFGFKLGDVATTHREMAQLKVTNRKNYLDNIARAMEGRISVEEITLPVGKKHTPATIEAVREALTKAQEQLKFSTDVAGKSPLDKHVFSIINSLDASQLVDGDMSYSVRESEPQRRTSLNSPELPSGEDIENFRKQVRGSAR